MRKGDENLKLNGVAIIASSNLFIFNSFFYLFAVKDMNDIDPDDMCDDAMGSDMEGSETDSKVSDSKKGDGKSQGNSSKPRR